MREKRSEPESLNEQWGKEKKKNKQREGKRQTGGELCISFIRKKEKTGMNEGYWEGGGKKKRKKTEVAEQN